MRTRPLTPSDYPALRAFDCAPLPALRDGELRLFTQWCCPLSFVVEATDGPLRGFALAMESVDRETVFLHYVVVAERLRGYGWGGRLLAAVETAAAHQKARRVALYTTRAGAYYVARGYDPDPAVVNGEQTAYNAARQGGQYFSKRLAVGVRREEVHTW